jgi:peptidoglycan-N-acetylglucosamine deacetylase
MTRRWDDWKWEEPSEARRAAAAGDRSGEPGEDPSTRVGPSDADETGADTAVSPGSPPGARRGASELSTDGQAGGPRPQPGRDVFRRRRAAAGLLGLALVVLSIAAVASKGGAGANHTAARAHVARLAPSAAEQTADREAAEQQAIDRVLAYTPAVTSGGPTGNEVALTFDDGPGPYTLRLVDELNRLKVHATFFAIGSQERYFSEGTVAEVDSGDVVGDHTETHPMMAQLSAHDQYEQLFDQMAQIEVLGGKRPRLFRPPYGSFDATTFRELHHLRLLMILWSVDTADYTLPGTEAIVQRALAGAKPGAIILMHDGGGDRSETIAALPAIVRGLRRLGLRPVTVPQLLRDDPPPAGQPIPTSLTGG